MNLSIRSVLLMQLVIGSHRLAGQSIVTFAGGGTEDGRPATLVSLSQPSGVALGPDGTIYISDTLHGRVRRVSASTGVVTTVAGDGTESFSGDGGPATLAGLSGPFGIVVDEAGNIYFADTGISRVRRIAAGTGIVTTVAGNGEYGFSGDGGPATAAALHHPRGIALDGAGNIFIADMFNHKVRRVDALSGTIATFAGTGPKGSGNGGVAGDGGPATAANLNNPYGVAVDTKGNVYIADTMNHRIRKVAAMTGIISTIVGNGPPGWNNGTFAGDGGPATTASLNNPHGVAVDPAGDLYIADTNNGRIRRVAASTALITSVAGGGRSLPEDGTSATTAILSGPKAVAVDRDGNILVANTYLNTVHRVSAATGLLTTVAGYRSGDPQSHGFLGDNGPASAAGLFKPSGVSSDIAGNVYIADWYNDRVRKVLAGNQTILTTAGGGNNRPGDGGPSTAARLSRPTGVAVSVTGDVFMAESTGHRILKVDAVTGDISIVAGTGARYQDTGGGTFGGDGGPATEAGLDYPSAVAIDPKGNLYIADERNQRVRKVDGATRIISTVAGSGPTGMDGGAFAGDGGPATLARLWRPCGVAVSPEGNLYIGDSDNKRVRMVDAESGRITTVAGGGTSAPDEASPATLASLVSPCGVTVDRNGDIYLADSSNPFVTDSSNDRIRRVARGSGLITTVAGKGRSGVRYGSFTGDGGPATAATLNSPWDVEVDATGNLFIADKDNNRVRAVFRCREVLAPFETTYPMDGTLAPGSGLQTRWGSSAGAFSYDLVLDGAFPPSRVLQADLTAESVQLSGLEPGRTYYWQVRAKGDPYCPPVERLSGIRRFAVPLPCAAAPPPVLTAPVSPSTTTALAFGASAGAGGYDVYLSSGTSPPLLVAAGLTSPTFAATGLVPGATYRWRVVARASCNPELTTSSVEGTFTVPGACASPPAADLVSPVDGAGGIAGSSTLSWRPAPGASTFDLYLGPGGGDPPLLASGLTPTSYPVSLLPSTTYRWKVVAHASCEAGRTATSATYSFTTGACVAPSTPANLSSSKTSALRGTGYTVAWVTGDGHAPGTSYRLVRSKSGDFSSAESFTTAEASVSLSAADATTYHHRVSAVAACGASSAASAPLAVTVSAAPPHIEFTNPPRAVVIRQPAPGIPLPRLEVEVRNTGTSDFVGFFNTSQTVPFFIPSETAISLRAGEIRIYYLQLSGVPSDSPGQYDGILSLMSANPTDTTAYPQAAISLVVTGLKPTDPIPSTTAPLVLSGGAAVDRLRFASAAVGQIPPDISVELKNAGSTPLYLAADVLPDPWVSLEPGWNGSPLAPGATRTVKLRCERIRGESGGAFPRSTYLTFRTVDGKSSRVLLEDPGPLSSSLLPGRSVLTPGEWSWIVPSVVNAASKSGGRYVSRVLITNLGTDPTQADLYYTPDTGDPGTSGFDTGKVLFSSLIVPPNDVLALTDPVGQLFGITDNSSGQLEIRSSRIGQLRVQSVVDAPAPNGGSFGFQLPTVKSGEGARPGAPQAVVGILQNATYRTNLILTETSGQSASVTVTLYDKSGAPIGSTQRDLPPYAKKQFPVSELAGSNALSAGSLEIHANPGSAGSVVGVVTTIDGRTGDASSFLSKPLRASTSSSVFTIASVVVSNTFKSRVEIRNDDEKPVTYSLTYRGSTGTRTSEPRMLAPKAMDAWDNVLSEVFDLAPSSFGPLQVSADSPNVTVVSRVYSETAAGSYGDTIPGLALDDPTTTGSNNLTVLTDGLEGTAGNDKSRGARTNLILTEAAGKPVDLVVSIWEKSQRRVAPAGTLSLHLEPYQQLQINDLFGDEGFAIGNKDRLNVLCTISPKAGSQGRVLALATRIDNRTNDTKNLALRP